MAKKKTTTNAMQKTATATERMEAIFKRVGADHNYSDVAVEITPFKDFKVKWTRSCNWIRFQVVDYLADMPSNVLEDFADNIFARIQGEDVRYPPSVIDYLTSDGFRTAHRDTFFSRTGLRSEEWLTASLDRLTAKGLVRVRDVQLGAFSKPDSRISTKSSLLFRVVAVNSKLAEDLTDDELDCAVYQALCFLETRSFGADPVDGDRRMTEALDRMENYSKLEFAIVKKGYHMS